MILVTGGAGYVGSHYVRHELDRGRKVVVLDSLVHGRRAACADATLVVGDVGDRALLDRLFTDNAFDAVVHFAAFAYVGESMEMPGRYFRNNVASTLTLLEAMRDHGIGRLVFSSSCATFGHPVYTPIDEAHPQSPINPYGQSKHMCEGMLTAFERAHGLRSVALRYFNAAGADPEGRLGESHDPETHLVPLVLQAALGRRPVVSIFGDDYDTRDGTCVRDYIHVIDLAFAHARALDRLLDGGAGGVYNLGGGNGYSVREVVRVAERVTGRSVPVAMALRRPGDPAVLVATSRLALAELSFAPRHSDLDEIVASAWRWEQNRRY